ncbi:AsnC family protein [Arthrobacter sp. SLBN-53]|uniref:AsnC family protein n=1 Tax=Arthrobacter sp. SLBN-53 TaxID=2768412 RepID=UPI001C20854E|nr:AsnC family protein [Arthrobacter sp. SLBN-53]
MTETSEFAAFTRRIVRAYARRVGDGDVEALPELLALAGEVDAAIAKSVDGLRNAGYSWAEIATRLGTTRQAAQQRFGRAAS